VIPYQKRCVVHGFIVVPFSCAVRKNYDLSRLGDKWILPLSVLCLQIALVGDDVAGVGRWSLSFGGQLVVAWLRWKMTLVDTHVH
jgi:hypothetical protein